MVSPLVPLTPEQQRLAEENYPLVWYVAGRFAHIPERAHEELVSKLTLRLLKAIAHYDPERGVKISSYLVRSLEGEAKHFFRDDVWFVRPPRKVRERALAEEDDDDEQAEQLRSCVVPVSLDAALAGAHSEFAFEFPADEELLEDRVVNEVGGTAIVEAIFEALAPEEQFILAEQMDAEGQGVARIAEHFRLPAGIARAVWIETQEKVKLLYARALAGEALPESAGCGALQQALIARFRPETESFVERRRSVLLGC